MWSRVNLLFEILFLILYVLAITTEFESVALAGPAVFLKRNGVDLPFGPLDLPMLGGWGFRLRNLLPPYHPLM